MSERPVPGRMTVEEYFRFEKDSPTKHEYVAGEVYAMSGVTIRHNPITAIAELRTYLIVDHGRRRVERHWRDTPDGEWFREEVVGEGRVNVPCLDVEITPDEIYRRVEFPAVGEPEVAEYGV
jgi:Uma2 family endonuclease